jgi:hypothetical protein
MKVMRDWKDLFVSRASKRETARLMDELRKADDHLRSQRMTKEQAASFRKYTPEMRRDFIEKAYRTEQLGNEDIDFLYRLYQENKPFYFHIVTILSPLAYVKPDNLLSKENNLRYDKVFEIISDVLTKNDQAIDPYGSVKQSVLMLLGRWFVNPNIRLRDPRLRPMVEPLQKDPRFLVALGAKYAMRHLSKQ